MKLYNEIELAIRQHKETLYVGNAVQETDVRHAIRWVMRDNPDIFWYVHQYRFDKDNGMVLFNYRCSSERSAIIQKSINDVVDNDFHIGYVRTLKQIEQVAYVYKWLLTYCNYNVNSAYNQNIDSVFVRRNSVCTGYAKAAQYLFKLLGIESRLVFGRLNNDREEGRHCWNTVSIEGCYYHLDVCLGDLALENVLKKAGAAAIQRCGDYNYNCFCVSTDEISKTRSIEDVETLPLCNDNLPLDEIEELSRIGVKERNGIFGCLLTHIGSSADIFLCAKDKNVVLKKFRGGDSRNCVKEYGFMDHLRGCKHLLQLDDTYCDLSHNIVAVEQSTPLVDLFCSHYYHPTLNGVLTMIKDVTLGWLECRQRGILYRDIHVCNIYKSNDGRYKLGDFGSCTYEHGALRERVGNPWFMSPETYISGRFDERSAVYSIMAVLYFVLNGMRPPFVNGNNDEEALQRKMNGELLPEPALLHSFPKAVAELIMTRLVAKGCAYYPSERLCSCNELLHILEIIHSALKDQRIELRLVQQNPEVIYARNTIQDVIIPRDIHHRLAYGEEVEREAMTMDGSFSQEDIERKAMTMYDSFHQEGIEKMVMTNAPDLVIDIDNDGSFEKEVVLDDFPDEIRTTPTDDDVVVSPIPMTDDVENYCRTMGIGEPMFEGSANEPAPCLSNDEYLTENSREKPSELNTFSPVIPSKGNFWNKLFGKKTFETYSSIFAPAELKRGSHMLVQVYLHLYEETEKVQALAQESQKDAKRRDFIPLQCKLRKGDKVDVLLNIYGETLLKSDKKNIVWQGSFTKCSFDYFVPKDIDVDELSCVALLTVNEIPVGEMRFVTKIVDAPRHLNTEIFSHKYNKVFISYAHKDEARVKSFHEGLKLAGIEHFFDRTYLKTGDVFPQVIQDYINSADLFVLFWSENAAESEYVRKERTLALKRAFPQVKPQQSAKLSIYPMSIEPRAELPVDMRDNYHFGEI